MCSDRAVLSQGLHPQQQWVSSMVPGEGTCASCATHYVQTYSLRWLSGGAGVAPFASLDYPEPVAWRGSWRAPNGPLPGKSDRPHPGWRPGGSSGQAGASACV